MGLYFTQCKSQSPFSGMQCSNTDFLPIPSHRLLCSPWSFCSSHTVPLASSSTPGTATLEVAIPLTEIAKWLLPSSSLYSMLQPFLSIPFKNCKFPHFLKNPISFPAWFFSHSTYHHWPYLTFYLFILLIAWPVAQTVENLDATQETWVQSLGWEDPLEKEMATHSSILAWRIPWTEELGGLQSTKECKESDTT